MVRRILLGLVTIWAVSVVSFAIISLPPGDYVSAYIAQLKLSGEPVSEEEAANLRQLYGLGQPIYVQYLKWASQASRGNFGVSMQWGRPVMETIGDRLWLTVALAFFAVMLTWMLAIPIGIYSAVKQYSIADYSFTFIGFVGLAIPNFLLALVLMYLGFVWFDASIGGLFSDEYATAPYSIGKLWDLLKHLWMPSLILALAGTAELIRILRANLLDELRKPYVVTARAKGLSEWRLIMKYPVRVALNPLISTVGYLLALPGVGQHHCLHRPGPADGGSPALLFAHRPGHVPGRDDHPADRDHDRRGDADFGPPPGVGRSPHQV